MFHNFTKTSSADAGWSRKIVWSASSRIHSGFGSQSLGGLCSFQMERDIRLKLARDGQGERVGKLARNGDSERKISINCKAREGSRRRNLRSIIGNTASGSDCFYITFRVSNSVAWNEKPGPEVERFDRSIKIGPIDHLGVEELELGARELEFGFSYRESMLYPFVQLKQYRYETAWVGKKLILTLETMALLRD
ncbi:hypothetical protein Tco_0024379 [Tanacetum coccineum]